MRTPEVKGVEPGQDGLAISKSVAARMLGTSVMTIHRLMRRSEIATLRVGRRRLAVLTSLRECVARNSQ